jgi:hypothetical protein
MRLVSILDKNRAVNNVGFIHKPYLWIFIELSTASLVFPLPKRYRIC